MSANRNYNKFLDEIIKEVEEELEESSTTGNIDGYQTPHAFGDDSEKNKNRKKQVATQAGYSVVDGDVKNIDETKDRDYKAEYQARKKDYYKKYQSSDKAKKYRAELNKYNRKKGTYGNGDGLDASHKGGKIVGFETENKNRSRKEKSRLKKEDIQKSDLDNAINRLKQVYKWLDVEYYTHHNGKKIVKINYIPRTSPQSQNPEWVQIRYDTPDDLKQISKKIKFKLTEAKKPKRRNRWLELKNDDSMHGHKKLAVGLKELKYQLREVEKFLGWYNKLKNINELDSDNYWKRTNNNIYKIKERLVNIVKKIQEIEK